jgi:hypothetical protein
MDRKGERLVHFARSVRDGNNGGTTIDDEMKSSWRDQEQELMQVGIAYVSVCDQKVRVSLGPAQPIKADSSKTPGNIAIEVLVVFVQNPKDIRMHWNHLVTLFA